MKFALATIAVGLALNMTSAVNAQTNDHFARQRREAVAKQEAARHHYSQHRYGQYQTGHWGGPTTTHRYYQPTRHHFQQQAIQYYPVVPYGGSPYGYGVPYGGFYGGYASSYRVPAPNIYIHRQIHVGR